MPYHRGIICIFDDDVGIMQRRTVMDEQGLVQWTQHTTLLDTTVQDEGKGQVIAEPNRLMSIVRMSRIQLHMEVLMPKSLILVINEQHPYVHVVAVHMGEGQMKSSGNGILCYLGVRQSGGSPV